MTREEQPIDGSGGRARHAPRDSAVADRGGAGFDPGRDSQHRPPPRRTAPLRPPRRWRAAPREDGRGPARRYDRGTASRVPRRPLLRRPRRLPRRLRRRSAPRRLPSSNAHAHQPPRPPVAASRRRKKPAPRNPRSSARRSPQPATQPAPQATSPRTDAGRTGGFMNPAWPRPAPRRRPRPVRLAPAPPFRTARQRAGRHSAARNWRAAGHVFRLRVGPFLARGSGRALPLDPGPPAVSAASRATERAGAAQPCRAALSKAISNGTEAWRMIDSVTPPRMNCLSREWP